MNPFILNKMHSAFVPDRLTDISTTTPAVTPEPTVQPRHIHTNSFPKYIDVTTHCFDVVHRSDIAMLMSDGDNVKVMCDVVVEDDCRGVDMLSHVFGIPVDPTCAAFIEHDGKNTASVLETLRRLYRFEDTLVFVVLTHTNNSAAIELIAALMLDSIEPQPMRYGHNSFIYYNPTVIAQITEHEQMWRGLVSRTEGCDKLNGVPDGLVLNRRPTLESAIGVQTTPLNDTEYYRREKIRSGVAAVQTESHAFLLSSKHTDHVHQGDVSDRRITMAVTCAEQERFVVPADGHITTNTNDLIALMSEVGIDHGPALMTIPSSWKPTK